MTLIAMSEHGTKFSGNGIRVAKLAEALNQRERETNFSITMKRL